MNAHTRNFVAPLAVREHVPLLIGLMGPSGGGKTFSALRLATGIQRVVGGDIFVIDTEARRALHYADRFRFRHLDFKAPFGSLDYLEALRFCASEGARTVIVDSMSHEHEGPGGLLDLQDQELQRLAGDDYGTWKADRFNMLAWQKPKANRRKLINGLLQMECNFIFCFRAKETSKPVKKLQDNGREKTVIEPMGFMPIAGDEFVFEMTMNALLLPGAGGVPTWQSQNRGEQMMMKLPEQFKGLMERPRPLDEDMGLALATWAQGDTSAAKKLTEDPAPPVQLVGADFDPIAWAGEFNRSLDGFMTDTELEQAWTEARTAGKVAKLTGKNRDLAQQLVDAVKARLAEIRGGGQ
ncbi:AAA family ATPase [Phenylobacterium sp.]|uniref:AAA family ATPase n=1 Tax=Phenylobacterium sp. TaxID=1871053 RepID=UPI003929E834